MKNTILLTILLTLTMWSFSQTRPPIVTNQLQVQEFIWENNLIDRGELKYFRMVGDTCFQISEVQETPEWSQNYCFEKQISVYWEEGDLYVCEGCTINYNDSIFIVRRDPVCSNCWQYSYTGSDWRDLFCETNLDRTFKITPSSDSLLKMGDFQVWDGEYNLLAGVTYVGFRAIAADSGKVLINEGDTIYWKTQVPDSVFINGLWQPINDTITIPGDSVYYYDGWLILPDTIPYIDQSDSIYFEDLQEWKGGGDSVDINMWNYDFYGINYIGNIGVGNESSLGARIYIDAPADYYGIVSNAEDLPGLRGSSITSHGVVGYSTSGQGVIGSSSSGFGVWGSSDTKYSGYFNGGLGLITDNFTIGNEDSSRYEFPAIRGNEREVLMMGTDSNLHFTAVDSLIADSVFVGMLTTDTIYSTIIRVDSIYVNNEEIKDEKVLLVESNGYPYNTGYLWANDFSVATTPNDSLYFKMIRDSIYINETWVKGNDSITIPSFWDGYYTEGVGLTSIHTSPDYENVAVSIGAINNGSAMFSSIANDEELYSGYFAGGIGLYSDKLKVGTMQYPYSDGTANQCLITNGLGVLSWSTISSLPSGTNGDILYYNNGWQKLAKGGTSTVLTISAGLPAWRSLPSDPYPFTVNYSGIYYDDNGDLSLCVGDYVSPLAKITGYSNDTKAGVFGYSSTGAGYGVRAESSDNHALYASSTNKSGVYGTSVNSYGVQAAGMGMNITTGALFMAGNSVIASTRIADFISLKISGTERINSSGNFIPANGVSGSFTTTDGKTITITNGIVTAITTP